MEVLGKIVRRLANGLKDKGNDVLIAYGRKSTENKSDTFDFSDRIATIWHVLMTRFFGRHGLHSVRATRKLIKK